MPCSRKQQNFSTWLENIAINKREETLHISLLNDRNVIIGGG